VSTPAQSGLCLSASDDHPHRVSSTAEKAEKPGDAVDIVESLRGLGLGRYAPVAGKGVVSCFSLPATLNGQSRAKSY
jgi:hypothetical protein